MLHIQLTNCLKFSQALVDSFVEFDRTIVNREVVTELKRIAGKPEDDIEDEDEMDNLYQEATMPIEDVIAKYEANESGPDTIPSTESPFGEMSDPNIKVLKNPHVAGLASSSESKGISPFLRAKTAPFDKNSECDESIAKEIDFKEGTISEITNGISKDGIDSENSNKEDSNKDTVKHEVNGEHNPQDSNTQANSVSDSNGTEVEKKVLIPVLI